LFHLAASYERCNNCCHATSLQEGCRVECAEGSSLRAACCSKTFTRVSLIVLCTRAVLRGPSRRINYQLNAEQAKYGAQLGIFSNRLTHVKQKIVLINQQRAELTQVRYLALLNIDPSNCQSFCLKWAMVPNICLANISYKHVTFVARSTLALDGPTGFVPRLSVPRDCLYMWELATAAPSCIALPLAPVKHHRNT
jgi:hypothetical protein